MTYGPGVNNYAAEAMEIRERIENRDRSALWVDAQLQATLALVEEQRIANLLAVIGKTWPDGTGAFSPPVVEEAVKQVQARLGLLTEEQRAEAWKK